MCLESPTGSGKEVRKLIYSIESCLGITIISGFSSGTDYVRNTFCCDKTNSKFSVVLNIYSKWQKLTVVMIDFRWFTLVGTGMLVHLSDMCLMGMCCQHKEFDAPNLGSALFTFSTLVIITAHSLIPPAMCNMHKALALIFEVSLPLFSQFVTRTPSEFFQLN